MDDRDDERIGEIERSSYAIQEDGIERLESREHEKRENYGAILGVVTNLSHLCTAFERIA